MDPDIEELKQKVDQLLALTDDTNRVVRSMRSTQRWGHFFQIVWWLFVLGASGWAYYYFLQPYMNQILHVYQNFQTSSTQFQGFEQQAAEYFKQHFSAPASMTMPTQPTQ